jgi:hypothetical protein
VKNVRWERFASDVVYIRDILHKGKDYDVIYMVV